MLHVHILDALEALQSRPALGEERLGREQVVLPLIRPRNVEDDIDKLPQAKVNLSHASRERCSTTNLRIFPVDAILEHQVDERRHIIRLRLLVSQSIEDHEPQLIPGLDRRVRDERLHTLHPKPASITG